MTVTVKMRAFTCMYCVWVGSIVSITMTIMLQITITITISNTMIIDSCTEESIWHLIAIDLLSYYFKNDIAFRWTMPAIRRRKNLSWRKQNVELATPIFKTFCLILHYYTCEWYSEEVWKTALMLQFKVQRLNFNS